MNYRRIRRTAKTIMLTGMAILFFTFMMECFQITGWLNLLITTTFILLSLVSSEMNRFSILPRFGRYIEVLASLIAARLILQFVVFIL